MEFTSQEYKRSVGKVITTSADTSMFIIDNERLCIP